MLAVINYNDIWEDTSDDLARLSTMWMGTAADSQGKKDSSCDVSTVSLLESLKGKVFIDAAVEENEAVRKFKNNLNAHDKKVEWSEPAERDDPTEMFEQLNKTLNECDIIITFYDKAPLSWLVQHLGLYRIIQIKRKKPLAIYIISSQSQPTALRNLPPNTRWIDNRVRNQKYE